MRLEFLQSIHRNLEITMQHHQTIDFDFFRAEAGRLRRAEMAALEQALLRVLSGGLTALHTRLGHSWKHTAKDLVGGSLRGTRVVHERMSQGV
jgi:hypothetical protein